MSGVIGFLTDSITNIYRSLSGQPSSTQVTPPQPGQGPGGINTTTTTKGGSVNSQLPAALFGNIDDFLDKVATDPKALGTSVRTYIETIAIAAGVLSLIPTESNVGGPLSARLIDRLLGPFHEAAYSAPIVDRLRGFFPTEHVATRMLVAMVQDGSIEEMDLVSELVKGGVRDDSIKIITKYARVKRFETETKDDVALLKSYYEKWVTAQIAEAQDSERAVIAELKAQRKALTPSTRGVSTQVVPSA